MLKEVLSSIKKIGKSEPAADETLEVSSHAALLAAMAERDFLDLAINTLQDFFLVIDPDGRIVGFNEYTKSFTGYTDEEIFLNPIGTYCPEEEAPGIKETFSRALGGELSKIETQLICKDGHVVPVECLATPLPDRRGDTIGILVLGRDLTARKQAEEALKRSEEHFRALTENSVDLVEIISPDDVIEYISPGVERILGYHPEELIGKSGFELNHPDEIESIQAAISEVIETGNPGSATFRCRHKDGTWLVFEGVGSLLPGPPGRQRLVVNIRDVTERVRMEERLRITQFEVDNALDTVIRVGPDGRILYANREACGLLGRSYEEMLSSFVWQVPLSIKEVEWPDVWDRRAELFPGQREIEISSADGSGVSLELALGILHFEDDEHLVIFGRDITCRKKVEDELSQANRELEIFARTVTHDIMAPLSAVSIVGESVEKLLVSGFEKENVHLAREMMVTLRECIADAIGLTNEVVSLSQVRPFPGTIEPVNVSSVVNRVAAQLGPEIISKEVELKVDPDLGEVSANPTHVYQLFINLISNAVKYNTNKNPVIKVSRLDGAEHGVHRFQIRDNGPGIKDEELADVFQPFYKGTDGGTGLGLATVQKVVKLYGGDVWVRNDRGARFEFTLHDAPPVRE